MLALRGKNSRSGHTQFPTVLLLAASLYRVSVQQAPGETSSDLLSPRSCLVVKAHSVQCHTVVFLVLLGVTPLSHERLVANAHELGTSQDSLETSQDGLGCVLARPCMSRQVTETEREIPFSVTD